jgi:hypothetical protein
MMVRRQESGLRVRVVFSLSFAGLLVFLLLADTNKSVSYISGNSSGVRINWNNVTNGAMGTQLSAAEGEILRLKAELEQANVSDQGPVREINRLKEAFIEKQQPLEAQSTATCASRSCAWDKDKDSPLEECYHVLAPELKAMQNWVFLGDSTMVLLVKALEAVAPYNSTVERSGRCNREVYYGFPSNTMNRETGGPVDLGHEHVFCTDCSQCNNERWREKDTSDWQFEFTAVEYARRAESTTASTKTTQETGTYNGMALDLGILFT